MPYVLSIDPAGESGKGGETGIARGYFDDETPYYLTDHWAIPSGVDAFREWFNANDWDFLLIDYVLCEDFVLWNKVADPSPLRVIGAAQFVWPDVILRRAGQRSFITDDQMKSLGAYIAGGHHRDVTEAARHAVAWLVKDMKHVPTQKVVLT